MVDGYHRFRACSELGVSPIPYTVPEKVKTVAEALEYSFDINFARRQLTPFQKAEWAYKVKYPTLKKKAHDNQLEALRGGTLREQPPGRVSEIIADEVGVGKSTFNRSKKIIETHNRGLLSNQVLNDLRSGKLVRALEHVYPYFISIFCKSEFYPLTKDIILGS